MRSSVCLLLPLLLSVEARAERLKDLADVRGSRSNQLVGYGLVVGLSGTGDDASLGLSGKALESMLKRLGVQSSGQALTPKNVASVVVTADLPTFIAEGQRIDVVVASIGNAKSLEGGTLLSTPLKGPDFETYALAQGQLSVGGFEARGASGSRTTKNHTTSARIPGGAIVERRVEAAVSDGDVLEIHLREPDFTNAVRIAEAVDRALTEDIAEDAAEGAEPAADSDTPENAPRAKRAEARDSGTVVINLPKDKKVGIPALISSIESLEVTTDVPARVVVNERTGTVVLGEQVELRPAAIAHGGLTLEIRETRSIVQPPPLSKGQTTVVPESDITARETPGELHPLNAGASLGEVVEGLNALGVAPRDMIAILQALKAAGALRAELIVQ